jgi:hypothetical protein
MRRDDLEVYDDLVAACTRRLGLEAASYSAVTPDHELQLLSADPVGRVLSLLERHLGQGPATEAVRAGASVGADGPATLSVRWPRLAPELEDRGISSGYGVPVLDRAEPAGVRGVLQLFAGRPLQAAELELAQTLAELVLARDGLAAELHDARHRVRRLDRLPRQRDRLEDRLAVREREWEEA